ncbi:glycosyltransferase [Halorubrum kocurii]|uniref:Beta-1,4-galactosyltransferase n=1 Tax=Halorubrum kocurii JCM 14978 TaxID=1230456 RepID=M0PNB3_9EURY|nr:glycosyltransferase [Halorubrum kocurii]EMA70385.1 beta-1,4-galactosyltransferase [Halorubrum kocurii JCM 14978]
MIYVTVGVSQGFERLVRKADNIAATHQEEFLIQTGDTNYQPKYADSVDILPPNRHEKFFRDASVVVGHAGTGTFLTALDNDVRLVLFPRNPELDEVYDDHQQNHVDGWSNSIDLTIASTTEELATILSAPKDVPQIRREISGELQDNIGMIVQKEAEERQLPFSFRF